jgi:hypothetical protein
MPIFDSHSQQMAVAEATVLCAEDFPAAHSMDVDFFALDREGNVARFSAWLDEYSPVPPALQIEKTRANLTSLVEAAIKSCREDLEIEGERAAEASERKFVYSYIYQRGGDGESALFRADDLPPASPELMSAKRDIQYPESKHPLDFPWLSFDDAPTLSWPPRRPTTLAEWQAVLNNAEQHWLDALNRLKTAERRQPVMVDFWQKIADRRYASLQVLERIVDQLKDR